MTSLLSDHRLALVERLGWTLIHFLWQGTAIAALLALWLWLARPRSAAARYLLSSVSLVCMAVAPIVTFLVLTPRQAAPRQTEVLLAASLGRWYSGPDAAPTVQSHAWLALIVCVWCAGVLLLTLRFAAGWVGVCRLRSRQTLTMQTWLVDRFTELAAQMQVRRPVQLLGSAVAQVPCVVGGLRPVVLLPVAALAGLTTEQLTYLLAHELAHVRRHDYLVNLLQSVVEAALFYHPAVWWVSHTMRVERENCCDDLAVAVVGDRLGYARALTALEEARVSAAALAMAGNGGNLLSRIRRIVGVAPERQYITSAWASGLIVALLAGGLAAPRIVRSQEEARRHTQPISQTAMRTATPSVLFLGPTIDPEADAPPRIELAPPDGSDTARTADLARLRALRQERAARECLQTEHACTHGAAPQPAIAEPDAIGLTHYARVAPKLVFTPTRRAIALLSTPRTPEPVSLVSYTGGIPQAPQDQDSAADDNKDRQHDQDDTSDEIGRSIDEAMRGFDAAKLRDTINRSVEEAMRQARVEMRRANAETRRANAAMRRAMAEAARSGNQQREWRGLDSKQQAELQRAVREAMRQARRVNRDLQPMIQANVQQALRAAHEAMRASLQELHVQLNQRQPEIDRTVRESLEQAMQSLNEAMKQMPHTPSEKDDAEDNE